MVKKSTIAIIVLGIILVLFLATAFIEIPEGTSPLKYSEEEQVNEPVQEESKPEPPKQQEEIKLEDYQTPEVKIEYTSETKNLGKTTQHTITTNNGVYSMRYLPEQVKDIPSPETIALKQTVYVTRDHNLNDLTNDYSSIAAIEFGRFIPGFESSYTTPNQATINNNLFVKTCSDTSSTEGVIKLQLGNQNAAYYLGDCLIVQGKDAQGLVKTADKVAYTLLDFF